MTALHVDASPSPWVVRHAALIVVGGRVLDVAAGNGRHAGYLTSRGFDVVAIDRDAAAVAACARLPGVTAREADLEGMYWPLSGERFDAIIVVHYLHRPRFADLVQLLAPAGVLIYETFAAGNEVHGKPSNSAFLLARDELLQRVQPALQVVAFEQGETRDASRVAVMQRIVAVGPAYPWPAPLAHASVGQAAHRQQRRVDGVK